MDEVIMSLSVCVILIFLLPAAGGALLMNFIFDPILLVTLCVAAVAAFEPRSFWNLAKSSAEME